MMSKNPFSSLDAYFIVCKLLTALLCLPWPAIALPTVMSLASDFSPGTPLSQRVLVRAAWLAVLAYPLIFVGTVLFAERVIATRIYPLGAVIAALPAVIGVVVMLWLFAS